jgi:hypothetical protein
MFGIFPPMLPAGAPVINQRILHGTLFRELTDDG